MSLLGICAHVNAFHIKGDERDLATIIWHTECVPEHYDLTLLHPDGKLGRDIAIMRAEIEELHARLARMPAVIARAAFGNIFSTSVVTTLLGWWFLAR